MSSLSYAPHEPGNVISDEVAWLQGAFVSSLLCGVLITLSAMSFLAVLKQRLRPRLRIAFLVYILILCTLMIVGQQTNLQFVQMGFIDQRNYPGGPNKFLSDNFATPVSLVSTTLFVFANWMMESLLVWRCKVVCYTGDQPVWYGVAIPLVILVVDYGAGMLFLVQFLQGRYPIKYGLAYAGASFLLNITVTAIIAGRLLQHRRRMIRLFGQGHGSHYASAATIVIESAALYTCFLILLVVFFLVGTAVSNVLQQAVAQVETITSLLIIYRIARGKDWRQHDVSPSDWRGDTEAQSEQVVHLERVADLPVTLTDRGVHTSSVSSKDETPSSADATPSESEVT